MRALWDKTSASAKVLPVVALLGFFVSISASSRSVSNGATVSCSYLDFAALLWAVICVVGGAVLVKTGLRPANVRERTVRGWHLGIGAVVAVVGVVHALRGLGVVGGPC